MPMHDVFEGIAAGDNMSYGDDVVVDFPTATVNNTAKWTNIPSECCYICDENVVGTSEDLKVTGSTVCHLRCYNAKRCLQRMVQKEPSLQAGLEAMMQNDPKKHAAVIASLASSKPHARTQTQRAAAFTFLQELASETLVRKKNSVVMLNFRQFKAWYKHNEGYTDEEAEARWHEDFANPDVQREVVGEATHLAVRLPTEISGIQQMVKRKTMVHESIAEGERERREIFKEIQKGGSIHDTVFSSVGGALLAEGASSSTPVPRTPSWCAMAPRTPALKRRRGVVVDDDNNDSSGAPGTPKLPAPGATGEETPGKSSSASLNVSTLNATSVDPDDSASQVGLSGAASSSSACGDNRREDSTGKMTPAAFIALKKQLQKVIAEKIATVEGGPKKVSMTEQLRSAYKGVEHDADIKALDIPKALEGVQAKIDELKGLSLAVGDWKLNDYGPEKNDEVMQQVDKMDEQVDLIKELLEAIKETKSHIATNRSRAKRKDRYERLKASKDLVKMGVPMVLANQYALCLNDAEPGEHGKITKGATWKGDLKAFGWDAPFIFKEGCEPDLLQKVTSMVQANKELIDQKLNDLARVQKQAVVFAPLFKVQTDCSTLPGLTIDDASFQDEGGSKPWVYSALRHQFQWSFTAWPWGGVPCFLVGLDNLMCVYAVPLDDMLQHGLANLDSVAGFLSTDKAAGALGHGKAFLISSGDMLYIPGGWVPLVMAAGVDEQHSRSSMIVQHILDPGLMTDVPAPAVMEISQCFERNLNKLGRARPWNALKAEMMKLVALWLDSSKTS